MTPDQLAKSGTEDGEQSALFAYALQPGYGQATDRAAEWAMLASVPNGGARSGATAARMKATGVRAGYPDIVLDVACGPWHGLRLEMKKMKGGVVAANQKEWHKKLVARGYCVIVCYGWKHAVQCINWYLDYGPYSEDQSHRFLREWKK
jgi:hypothetical protein